MSLFEDMNSSDSENDADYVPEGDSSDEEPIPRNVCVEERKDKSIPTEKSADVSVVDEKEKEKKRADDIYKSFLLDVETEMKEKSESVSSSSGYGTPLSSSCSVSPEEINVKNSTLDVEEKPKLYDFAGETVAVAEDGSVLAEASGSSENVPAKPAVGKKRGLESVLGIIENKKTKLSVLEKTKLDWNSYKKANSIVEELQSHKKGKECYTERMRFLERSDRKAFEIERSLRLFRMKKK